MSELEKLFDELLQLSQDDRQQRLEQLADEAPELKLQVDELLQAHQQAGSFLRAAGETTAEFNGSQYLGKQIRQYKLREVIGEGGMGVVYVAEQEKPLRRKVALKVIKPGMDSKAVLARFDAERQALAMMNHPNIAKVLDAGTTSEGHPYFVMELVSGQSITEYCDSQKLTIRERLDLFIEVCGAIQHAHQKGIIHRDIKPSNVLVTELDGKPVAKVIDFGVAKALNQSLTEQSIYTAHQAVIGTPLYMSPEQASFSAVDVDTRSDVYSLGVLLYELLTGTTPFTRDDLQQAAQDEVFRLIREKEPPRPSNRISSLGDTATQISSLRRTGPDQLGRTVKGDLDWIVMKALSKERGRRYDSAAGLMKDVSRSVSNDAIEARPPSLTYQLGKMWQRNAALFNAIALAVGVVTVCLVITSMSLVQTSNAVQELETVVRQLREDRSDRLIELCLDGRLDEAKLLLAKLEKAYHKTSSADEYRRLAAIVGSFGTDAERLEAHKLLGELARERPDDIIVNSLFVQGFLTTGDEWGYYEPLKTLQELSPQTFEEYLCRGYATSFAMPNLAIKDLEFAIKMRRSSGVAHSLYAIALSMGAQHEPQRANARHLLGEASRHAQISKNILPMNSTLGMVACLTADTGLLCAALSSNSTGISANTLKGNEGENLASQCAARLRESLTYAYDSTLHDAQLSAYQALTFAEASLEPDMHKVLQFDSAVPPTPVIVVRVIQCFYKRNDLRRCSEIATEYTRTIQGFNDLAFLPQFEYRIANGESIEKISREAKVRSKERSFDQKRIAGFSDWELLVLLGGVEEAQVAAKCWHSFVEEMAEYIPLANAFLPVSSFMAGSEEIALDVPGDQELGAFQIGFWLGLDALGEGDRARARILFENCSDSPAFGTLSHYWAKIYATRLSEENSEWLPWLMEMK